MGDVKPSGRQFMEENNDKWTNETFDTQPEEAPADPGQSSGTPLSGTETEQGSGTPLSGTEMAQCPADPCETDTPSVNGSSGEPNTAANEGQAAAGGTRRGGKIFLFGKTKKIRFPEEKERHVRNFRLALLFACVILATSIITSAVSFQLFRYYSDNTSQDSSETVSLNDSAGTGSQSSDVDQISHNQDGTLTIAEINRKVSPSVVFIGTTYKSAGFFGQTETTSGAGSGIILTSGGYILTNNHVIDSAETITVKLYSGESYEAKLVGADSQSDLAVIKIDAKNLKSAELGDSSKIMVGDLAVAIGNPLGTLEGTLTAGVISALNRSVTIDDIPMNLIQMDAAVNPGNSGGALVNAYGQVIGIVNAKTSAVGIEGLGYAIPINDAKTVADDLINKGYVGGRIRLGIATKDITSDLADYYDLPVGIYVVEVSKNSISDKAGIRAGDVIIGVNGKDVKTGTELSAIRDSSKIGDTLKVLLVRDGKEMSVKLVLEEYVPKT